MTQATALKLLAQDAEDLKVVAAALQDAVGKIGDISYEPAARRLTLAFNRYRWEAKGGETRDMEAVANVVINRLGHEGFPGTVCEVVKQGAEKSPCQFSWWCDGRPDQVEEADRYTIAKEVARKALNQQLPDRTDGALYFHDRSVAPAWARASRRWAISGVPRRGFATPA